MKNGTWEQLSQGKSTFIMCLCDHFMKDEIEETIQFVVKSEDITDYLVNEDKYIFMPRQTRKFNYQKFENAYKDRYLKEATIVHARKMIKALGDKSRIIDYKLLYERGA
jgi:hypothetical protein